MNEVNEDSGPGTTPEDRPDRAVLFVDGSNWYHGMKDAGVEDTMRLDYAKISKKLAAPREWVATRYYGVQLDQGSNPSLYANNRRFLDLIKADDSKISTHLGRTEPRHKRNPLAGELREFIGKHGRSLDARQKKNLTVLARRYENVTHYVEKGVDVNLAVDMYRLAHEDVYDAAYILSADGDYTPAVEMVKALGKTVYAACPNFGSALNRVCRAFICMDADWFADCYR